MLRVDVSGHGHSHGGGGGKEEKVLKPLAATNTLPNGSVGKTDASSDSEHHSSD